MSLGEEKLNEEGNEERERIEDNDDTAEWEDEGAGTGGATRDAALFASCLRGALPPVEARGIFTQS